jgi:Protein of unknown function (DUF1573)
MILTARRQSALDSKLTHYPIPQSLDMGSMHRLRPLLLAAFGILAISASAAAAGLQWDRESIEVTAQPDQQVVHVDFPFRNAGDKVITIVSVETSCRCTSADTAKRSYAPGERDKVGVDFTVGAQSGVVEKSVTATTDGPEPMPVVLSLRVTILPAAPAKAAGP